MFRRHCSTFALVIVAAVLPCPTAFGQGPRLIRDFNSGRVANPATLPYEPAIAAWRGDWYVQVPFPTGCSLYRVPRSGPPQLIREIEAYSGAVTARGLVADGDRLLFVTAGISPNGIAIWGSDGTLEGTRVVDAVPTSLNPAAQLISGPGGAYFLATTGVSDSVGLWKVGGDTPAFLINGGVPYDVRTNDGPVRSGGWLYYFGRSSQTLQYQLFRTNGQPDGAELVTSLPVTVGIGKVLYVEDSRVYFSATDVEHGEEVWITDTQTHAARLLLDLNSGQPSSSPSFMVRWQDDLYFTATDSTHGAELWRLLPDREHAELCADLNPGAAAGVVAGLRSTPRIVAREDGLYFVGSSVINGHAVEDELFVYHGAGTAPELVKEINTRVGESAIRSPLVSVGSSLVFVAQAQSQPIRTWTSDGTNAGTTVISSEGSDNTNFNIDRCNLAALSDAIGFVQRPLQYTIWTTNGTPAGTSKRLPQAGTIARTANVSPVRAVGTRALALVGSESRVWATDGTAAGTTPLTIPGSTSHLLTSGIDWNGRFYFGANSDQELWASDGTDSGTSRVKSLAPASYPNEFVAAGNGVVFTTFLGTGRAIWRSDGTETGTVMMGGEAPSSSSIAADGSTVFLLWSQNNQPLTLWRTDGSLANLTPMFTAPANNLSRIILTPNFVMTRSTRPDGSIEGTWSIDRNDNSATLLTTEPPELGGVRVGRLYYWYTTNGLYRTDGTSAGTFRVASINADSPGVIAALGEELLFGGYSASTGFELFATTGTPETVRLVSDVYPGVLPSTPALLTTVGTRVYFSAFHPLYGTELWVTDGTAAGTRLVADIEPGPTGSSPTRLTRAGNRLFFVCTTTRYGDDLWVLPTPSCFADFDGSGHAELGDLFEFLNRWFGQDSGADWNGSGTITLQDLFDFLDDWFAGC